MRRLLVAVVLVAVAVAARNWWGELRGGLEILARNPALIAFVVAYRVLPIGCNALGWGSLMHGHHIGRATLLRFRWIGESINSLLPATQMAGEVARARLLTARGVPVEQATAATFVDVVVSVGTQGLFAIAGLLALAAATPLSRPVVVPVVVCLLLLFVGLVLLIRAVHVDASRIARILRKFVALSRVADRFAKGARGVQAQARQAFADGARLRVCTLWHALAWLAMVGESYIILYALDVPVGLAAALAIESLSFTVRTIAFVLPGGVGAQEAAILLVAQQFGVPLEAGFSLAVAKRLRELLVGLPGLVAWLGAERVGWRWLLGQPRPHVDPAALAAGPAAAPGGARPRPSAVAGAAPLRVAVLLDLAWSPESGGHVRTWEHFARAATRLPDLVDITLHVSGDEPGVRPLSANVRFVVHPPVFSSARIPFLSHIPHHSDLASHHRRLSRWLRNCDVIHTTDAYFAFARTAERMCRRTGVPLVHSPHTDTPAYTQIYTTQTIERLFGRRRLGRLLLDRLHVPERLARRMQARLRAHERRCAYVLASRPEDENVAADALGPGCVFALRRGIDATLFSPSRRDRDWLLAQLGLGREQVVVLTVGRLDRVKNVTLIAQAVQQLRQRGRAVHLLCAGSGDGEDEIRRVLGNAVTCLGFVQPEALARYYASADIFAHAARAEVYANVVAEAMAAGLPILIGNESSRVPFEPDVGIVIDRDDVCAWVDGLDRLVGDEQLRRAMGAAGRRLVERRIPSWDEVFEQDVLGVWQKALTAPRFVSEALPVRARSP